MTPRRPFCSVCDRSIDMTAEGWVHLDVSELTGVGPMDHPADAKTWWNFIGGGED